MIAIRPPFKGRPCCGGQYFIVYMVWTRKGGGLEVVKLGGGSA